MLAGHLWWAIKQSPIKEFLDEQVCRTPRTYAGHGPKKISDKGRDSR